MKAKLMILSYVVSCSFLASSHLHPIQSLLDGNLVQDCWPIAARVTLQFWCFLVEHVSSDDRSCQAVTILASEIVDVTNRLCWRSVGNRFLNQVGLVSCYDDVTSRFLSSDHAVVFTIFNPSSPRRCRCAGTWSWWCRRTFRRSTHFDLRASRKTKLDWGKEHFQSRICVRVGNLNMLKENLYSFARLLISWPFIGNFSMLCHSTFCLNFFSTLC